MLRLRLAGSCAAAVTTTVRFESSKDKSFKRRVDASKKVVDDLFRNRSSRKAQSAMLRQRELEVDSSDPRADPLGRAARSTSRPVTFADDITDAEEKASALTVPSAQGSAMLPIDDPDFSVLTDDAFTYFPEDKAHEQVVPGQSMPPDGMRRYRMEVQYRGDHYLGWDRASDMRRRRKELAVRRGESQSEEEAENVTWAGHALSGLRSAKDAVAESLAVALDAKSVSIYPSVALETGAHSRRLTCHVDIPANTLMQSRTIMQRAHAWLAQKEEPLGILSFQRAPPDFHASRSALNRVYVYRILNRISPAVLEVGQHWHVDRYLDVDLMQAAATNQLQGVRDFGAFASMTVERTVRREGTLALTRDLQEIRVTRQDDEVLIWFVAKSFLRHQIRHMVSALKFVGQRVWTEEDLRLMVDRSFSSAHHVDRLRPPPAPAHGLTLWEVQYPAAMGATPPYVDSGPIEDAISTTPAAVKRPSDALASNKK